VHLSPDMRRSRLAAAAALLLAACSTTLPLHLATELAFLGPPGAFQVSAPLDLSADAGLWSRRAKVASVSVDEIRVTVVSVGALQQASWLALRLAVRAEGAPSDGSQDVLLPDLAGVPFVAGASTTVAGSPAVEALLLQVLQGTGRAQLHASGTLDGLVDATIRLELVGSALYSETFK
jgi:hypothetical protein